jgi:BirA family biotin operon repressor/biotin-[acetyl-CoA-carboxylase] ligase
MNSEGDRLDPFNIERHLATRTIGRNIVYRDSIDSTNRLAFDLAAAGCAEGTCVIAETQTCGRGRLQRRWHSPYGKNIYLSCVLRPSLPAIEVSPIAFVSCLAVFDAVRSAGVEPRLKWPNDVLTLDGKKLCGTLIELSTKGPAVHFVVVGIGLNVNMGREEMDAEIADTATSLFIETRKCFERAAVCGILLNGLEKYYEIASGAGVGEICRIWEERAKVRGTYMEIRQTDRIYRGVSEGLAADGALLLSENGTVTRVIAGDVSI